MNRSTTQLQRVLEQILGRDQSKGINHLSEALNIEQIFLEQGGPLCILVPELDSLTKDNVERLGDADKVAISILLDSLASSASQHGPGGNGFTWEELQSLLSQAGYLKPTGQSFAASKVMRGKRKIRWFKRLGDPGIEPNAGAVFELLLEIALGNQHAAEADSVDLTPLRDLISKRKSGHVDPSQHSEALSGPSLPPKRKPFRANSADSFASPLFASRRSPRTIRTGPRAENDNPAVLNTSSTQKYSLESRSRTDWPVLEIISLRFPTMEDSHFTASRLTVNAWTSIDRRLILPRAQTVVRIETFSKAFGARTEFIDSVDITRRRRAIAKTASLFNLV